MVYNIAADSVATAVYASAYTPTDRIGSGINLFVVVFLLAIIELIAAAFACCISREYGHDELKTMI